MKKLRTSARLTSKPSSPFTLEMAGYAAGRSDAVNNRKARYTSYCDNDYFAEGYCRGWKYVTC